MVKYFLAALIVAASLAAAGEPDLNVNWLAGSVNATVQQTAGPALRIDDRVRVSNTGIELLRG